MRPHPGLPAIVLFLILLVVAIAAHAAPRVQGRQVSIAAADAQQFLEGQFPHSQDMLGGLFEVTVSRPRLALPPGTRMQLGMDLALATAGGAPVPMGQLELTSALRYDTAQAAFFLDQPRIDAFHPPSGSGSLDDGSRELLNAWLADYARKEPVYRIDPTMAALLGGLAVQSAGVQDGRLVVTFNRDVGGMAGALHSDP
ncbi:DUF1439 domain-containing protein [Pseudoxanthomonas daejeonensis]|uniref:DUF1439 domain-containing protein n=1 Tax=Pseudoxanthomonas daejeonensis TaxID=266062 RepID=A0ABQ6Z9B0_9GAMM|nr:DUF1439 domain-containing protein [Pseudoxanthomonas daejeonensis]KAF1696251.1 DUF1439 domain-containing protein [Pseudoxanthomonas daejeonensis]